MQETRVGSPGQEDPPCPVHHNYWGSALELETAAPEARTLRSLSSATREATAVRSPRIATQSSPLRAATKEAHTKQQRPSILKIKYMKEYDGMPSYGGKEKASDWHSNLQTQGTSFQAALHSSTLLLCQKVFKPVFLAS